jgi:hypothetical protein
MCGATLSRGVSHFCFHQTSDDRKQLLHQDDEYQYNILHAMYPAAKTAYAVISSQITITAPIIG